MAAAKRAGVPAARGDQQGRRTSNTQARWRSQLGRAPVVGRDQPLRERRDRHRRHAHAGRHEGDREGAVFLEPARDGRHHRRKDGTGGDTDQHAVDQLEFEQAGGAARECQAKAQQDRARQHDEARPEAVGERAPAKAAHAHGEEYERHRHRYAGARPAGRFRHGLQEDGQRECRAHRDAAHQGACADNHPTVLVFHVRSPSRNQHLT